VTDFLVHTRASYDAIAANYAERHAGEIGGPFDRALLAALRESIPGGQVAELGSWSFRTSRWPGSCPWYALMHLPPAELGGVFAEFGRVLAPGGQLVVAAVAGNERVHCRTATTASIERVPQVTPRDSAGYVLRGRGGGSALRRMQRPITRCDWTAGTVIASVLEWVITRPEVTYSLEPRRFLLLLPVILVLTTIQASAEEFLFRGYLLQGTGLVTRRTVVLMLVNGVLFAVPHLGNPEIGSGFALLATYYFLFGAFATLVVLRAGSLHLVIGLHVANNLLGALVVGPPELGPDDQQDPDRGPGPGVASVGSQAGVDGTPPRRTGRRHVTSA
jgi:membrane protease YdiL (CAAX protease family)